jgi:hypothetical protein
VGEISKCISGKKINPFHTKLAVTISPPSKGNKMKVKDANIGQLFRKCKMLMQTSFQSDLVS